MFGRRLYLMRKGSGIAGAMTLLNDVFDTEIS